MRIVWVVHLVKQQWQQREIGVLRLVREARDKSIVWMKMVT